MKKPDRSTKVWGWLAGGAMVLLYVVIILSLLFGAGWAATFATPISYSAKPDSIQVIRYEDTTSVFDSVFASAGIIDTTFVWTLGDSLYHTVVFKSYTSVSGDTPDSASSWAFVLDLRKSGATSVIPTPAYWSFPTDSVVAVTSTNGVKQDSTTRTGVQSYDTTFSTTKDSIDQITFRIFPTGSTNPLSWSWISQYNSGPVQAPSDPDLCRVWGWVRDGKGQPIAYAKVQAAMPEQVKNTCDSAIMILETEYTHTLSTGYFEIDLLKTSCFTPSSAEWVITITNEDDQSNSEARVWTFSIPSDSSTYYLVY